MKAVVLRPPLVIVAPKLPSLESATSMVLDAESSVSFLG